MRIFITGATGYVGKAVAIAFRKEGHEVWGLARSREKSHELSEMEIKPILGNMNAPEEWIDLIQDIDIFVHAGFDNSGEGIFTEKKALEALIPLVQPTNTFIYTSGSWIYGSKEEIAKETDEINPIPIVRWRRTHEELILQAPCRSLVIRPALVYGKSGGLTSLWFKSAHANRVIQIGDGKNNIALIHVDDLAQGYVLAATKGKDKNIYNFADNSNYTVGNITEALLNLTGDRSIDVCSEDKAAEMYGGLAQGYMINQTISSERAKEELNWSAKHPPLLDDLKTYYEAWRTTSLT